MRESYRRHLPHQVPAGVPIFLTWNLKGALPQHQVDRIREQRLLLERQPPLSTETPEQRRVRIGKLLFHYTDRFLDTATDGPMDLKEPAAAQIVIDALFFGAVERYDLYAFVVMGNHVHALLTPHRELAQITKALKGVTANRINALHDQHGRTVWQDESYDHWARDEDESHCILEYIDNNPVKAGLCACPEQWPWSSASHRATWFAGQPWRRP